MSIYFQQIEAVACAVVIRSPTTFSWFGKHSPQLSRSVARALTADSAHNYLLFTLQSQLYNDFYCKGAATPSLDRGAGASAGSIAQFVQSLSEANVGHGYRSNGWEVLASRGNQVIVHKGGLKLESRLEDCLASGGNVTEGQSLKVLFLKEFLGISPGFYMAASDHEMPQEGLSDLVRLYWHLSPKGAVRFNAGRHDATERSLSTV